MPKSTWRGLVILVVSFVLHSVHTRGRDEQTCACPPSTVTMLLVASQIYQLFLLSRLCDEELVGGDWQAGCRVSTWTTLGLQVRRRQSLAFTSYVLPSTRSRRTDDEWRNSG